jgi:tRNA 2-thiocytidine biosynthesis protein TtcA
MSHGLGQAVCDWTMINHNDRIMVGVSGGRDSLILLHLLHALKQKSPKAFDLIPVHVDPGFEAGFSSRLTAYINTQYQQALQVEKTDFGIVAHANENQKSPCFLCSRLRRKRLFELAKEWGCKKIALGHHKDDLIETLFINMCYSGRIGTMKPRQSFFKGELDIIRPLSYVESDQIQRYANDLDVPVFDNPCPSAGQTKRTEVKQMLDGLYKKNRHIKGNIFRAMGNVSRDYLLETPS